jgi:hypothetical protein
VLCFSAFGGFSLKIRFSIELFCGTRIRGRFFLEKYALSFCYVDLLAFSIEVYRPLKIYTMISGDMLGALVLCFPASGETCAFSFGFFRTKWCSFSLLLLWRFVCRLLALFFFWLVGCLCGRLGLALGSPGLVGPPWTRDHFGCFFGSPLWRPKWSHGFCRNAQKQMGLGLFMRKGRLAESLHASLSVPKAAVFSNVFAILAGTFWFKMSLLAPNWGFHSVFLLFCSVPFVGSFWVLLTGWSAGWPLCGLI